MVMDMSVFSQAELDFLSTQTLGRLATVQPNGTLQVSPVGFQHNPGLDTIDISGYNMAASRKFRNVADNGRVAFVVDDVPSVQPWQVRCLEIRGRGEAVAAPAEEVPGSPGHQGGALVRIHPQRIISFGIDQTAPEPSLLRPNNRNVS
jgi:pyridoxamine 5'-phosphate oxidase family protein